MEWAYGILCWALGVFVGRWAEGAKWRANAKTYIRHESCGRIYKVEYADEDKCACGKSDCPDCRKEARP